MSPINLSPDVVRRSDFPPIVAAGLRPDALVFTAGSKGLPTQGFSLPTVPIFKQNHPERGWVGSENGEVGNVRTRATDSTKLFGVWGQPWGDVFEPVESRSDEIAPIAAAASERPELQAKALTTRWVDIWLIGGLSLVVFAVMYLVVPPKADLGGISWVAFYLAFLVNGPHFFSSYWHMYVDNRHRLREPRFAFAAFVVPIALVVALYETAQAPTAHDLGVVVNVMYLSVGWHYVKQIFGVTLVSSAAHGVPVNGNRKLLLRVNLLTIWAMSWLFSNQHPWASTGIFYGVPYTSADVDGWARRNHLSAFANNLRLVVYLSVAISAGAALIAFAREWVATGRSMALVGWVSWATIYVWYLPVFTHPSYGYLIPFFHSLQYLLFSVTLGFNKALDKAVDTAVDTAASDARAGDPVRSRRRFSIGFGGFVAFVLLGGAAGFHWIPEWLDRNHGYRPTALGGAYWVVAFNLFINIHHYFVDNAIWRGNNPVIRQYLRTRTALAVRRIAD